MYIKGGSRGEMKTKNNAREKNFFHDPLTDGEKLFKLELSIQDFLLLGPVRLLPLGDRAFSWPHENDSLFDRFYSDVIQLGIFRFSFRFRFLRAVGLFFTLGL